MYKVKAIRVESDSPVMGLASVVIDNRFRMDSIRIVKTDKNERGFFLAMPSYQTSKRDANDKPIYKDLFHPINKEFTEALNIAAADSLRTGEAVEIFRDRTEQIGVKVVPIENDNTNIKGDVTLFISPENSKEYTMVIDSIKVRLSESGENAGKNFVAMPSRKTKDGEYKNICYPVTKECREELFGEIFTKLNNSRGNGAGQDGGMGISDATEQDIMIK